MIELCLAVSDVTHGNENPKHASCGFHINFWIFLLMPFCVMMKKDQFKQKFLLWLFKNTSLIVSFVKIQRTPAFLNKF